MSKPKNQKSKPYNWRQLSQDWEVCLINRIHIQRIRIGEENGFNNLDFKCNNCGFPNHFYHALGCSEEQAVCGIHKSMILCTCEAINED